MAAEAPDLPADYGVNAKAVAEPQAALAGYRLATLLMELSSCSKAQCAHTGGEWRTTRKIRQFTQRGHNALVAQPGPSAERAAPARNHSFLSMEHRPADKRTTAGSFPRWRDAKSREPSKCPASRYKLGSLRSDAVHNSF